MNPQLYMCRISGRATISICYGDSVPLIVGGLVQGICYGEHRTVFIAIFPFIQGIAGFSFDVIAEGFHQGVCVQGEIGVAVGSDLHTERIIVGQGIIGEPCKYL